MANALLQLSKLPCSGHGLLPTHTASMHACSHHLRQLLARLESPRHSGVDGYSPCELCLMADVLITLGSPPQSFALKLDVAHPWQIPSTSTYTSRQRASEQSFCRAGGLLVITLHPLSAHFQVYIGRTCNCISNHMFCMLQEHSESGTDGDTCKWKLTGHLWEKCSPEPVQAAAPGLALLNF